MFGVISKFGDLFFEQQEQDENENAYPEERQPPNTEQIRFFTGVLSSLHTGYGLVDNHIYCSFETFKGFRRPSAVGDKVTVKATRKHDSAGWCAVDVEPCVDWEDQPTSVVPGGVGVEESVRQSIVAIVTEFSKRSRICVVEGMELNLSDVTGKFEPIRGDWIKVEYEKNLYSGDCKALSVCPAREKEFEGIVTGLRHNFGFIGRDLHFLFSVLENGYCPRQGDSVCGQAVECQQGHCKWRAVLVAPKRIPNLNLGLKNFTSPTQNLSVNELLENKCGISIPETLDFGTMLQHAVKTLSVTVRNNGNETRVLTDCRFCGHGDSFMLVGIKRAAHYEVEEWYGELEIKPRSTHYLVVTFEALHLGKERQLVVFDFGDFVIGRYFVAEVEDSLEHSLFPSSDYRHQKKRQTASQSQDKGEWMIPGQRVQRPVNHRLPQRLPPYPVPVALRRAAFEQDTFTTVAPVLLEELELANYSRRFQVLLHIEEIQQELEMREFDLERVCLRPFAEYLALFVPGLAEGRPSLLVGDKVYASAPGQAGSGPTYEGYIHEVLKDEILLKFHEDFHGQYSGEDYDVSFQFNRTPLRRCHCAVEHISKNASQVLFPASLLPKIPQTKVKLNAKPSDLVGKVVKVKPVHGVRKCPVAKLRKAAKLQAGLNHHFYNTKLNSRQRAAVMRILDGQCRPLPYILFGPPGTGKTVTVVETVLQVFVNLPWSRIIVCAPSNSAADLLAERLHNSGQISTGDMVRLNAFHRNPKDLSECIQAYCSDGDNLLAVSHYRILVSTCSTIGALYGLGLTSGQFTHAFIDECGQATEPESMVAAGLVAPGGGQVVLAGDPMQLGPVLRSHDTKTYGLGMSYLERLMQMPLYQRNERMFGDHGSYDPLLVTKLIENYRSHPALLKLPSELFYHNELEVAADLEVVQCLSLWPQLPNTDQCPMIFHGVRGQDLREGNSPSWFNPVEAVQVMHYLKGLVSYAQAKVTWDDIGIITPYRKQVEKIRVLIDSLGMDKIKVGSVEEFQGQERLAIIISTVRSNESMMSSDIHHNLGFLNNPKRFNVAITRAQALLIVIGNPHVLARDENWLALIRHCVKLKAYVGCDLPYSCLPSIQ